MLSDSNFFGEYGAKDKSKKLAIEKLEECAEFLEHKLSKQKRSIEEMQLLHNHLKEDKEKEILLETASSIENDYNEGVTFLHKLLDDLDRIRKMS